MPVTLFTLFQQCQSLTLQHERMLKIQPGIKSYGAACNLCLTEAAAAQHDRWSPEEQRRCRFCSYICCWPIRWPWASPKTSHHLYKAKPAPDLPQGVLWATPMKSSVQEHRSVSLVLHRHIGSPLQGSASSTGRGKEIKPARLKGHRRSSYRRNARSLSPEHWAGFERTLRASPAQAL